MDKYEIFNKALMYAIKKHENQLRKDGRPYIYHPIQVAQLTHIAGRGMRYQTVAVLHDVFELTDAKFEDIEEFGPEIVEAVKAITRKNGEDDESYLQRILQNKIARVVKSCDVIDNMYDTVLCDDSDWARKYIYKIRKEYWGRLSKATDMSIMQASEWVDNYPDKRPLPSFSKEDLSPYV